MQKNVLESKSVFSPAYWREAAMQLKSVRMLCIAALFIALRVAIKSFFIPVGENINIYFGYLVNALGAIIYGPVVALISAAVTDTLGALISQTSSGPYFFPFIFVEMSGSLLYALILWRRKLSAERIICSRFFVTVFTNIILNPIIMIWYYAWLNNGKSYAFITIPHVIKNAALFPAEACLLVIFLSAMTPALSRLHFISGEQSKPVMTAKHYVLLGILTVVAIAAVLLYIFVYLPNK